MVRKELFSHSCSRQACEGVVGREMPGSATGDSVCYGRWQPAQGPSAVQGVIFAEGKESRDGSLDPHVENYLEWWDSGDEFSRADW